MSISNAKKLVQKLSKDKKFKGDFTEEETKAALKFAKKAGLECTAQELKDVIGSRGSEASVLVEAAKHGLGKDNCC